MKIDEVILKPGERKTYNSFNRAWPIVVRNCSDILSLYKNNFAKNGVINNCTVLFRGIIHPPSDIFKGRSRNDRKVVTGSDQNAANLCDQLLRYAGFSAVRGNSLFCSSSYEHTVVWGKSYVVFPVNGFTYGWSKTHSNTAADGYDFSPLSYAEKYNTTIQELDAMPNKMEIAKQFVENNSLLNNIGIEDAIDKRRDLWVHGQMIAFDYGLYKEEIMKRLKG
jgi:hypothetical protein